MDGYIPKTSIGQTNFSGPSMSFITFPDVLSILLSGM